MPAASAIPFLPFPALNNHRKDQIISYGGMNMGTIVVGLIVAGMIALVVRSMVRDKKNGKSIQCGGECSHCGGHCGRIPDQR